MARQLRIEYEGAIYHIFSRGIERRTLFPTEADYRRFLKYLGRMKDRYGIRIPAYCLMPNHYHLMLMTPKPNLRSLMRELNSLYAMYFNHKYERVGTLFQGRYNAILVESASHGLTVARYIHWNPVNAGLAQRPEDWCWSSFPDYVGRPVQGPTDTSILLDRLGSDRPRSLRLFIEYMREGTTDGSGPLKDAVGGVVAGSRNFLELIKREKVPRGHEEGIARLEELQMPPSTVRDSMWRRVCTITGDDKLRRKLLIYGLKKSTPLSLAQIAGMTGAKSGDAVCQVVRRLERARRGDPGIRATLAEMDQKRRGFR